MRKIAGTTGKWLLSLLLPLTLQAQTLPAGVQCKDAGSTMLWQVQSAAPASSGGSVQLLGSIHVGKADFYPLPTVVDQFFHKANTLVFEVDPTSAESPQMAMAMLQRGTLPPDKTLDQMIDAATLTSLTGILQQLNMPMTMVSHMKPWMVSMLLSALQVQALGYQPELGVENYLMSQKPATVKVGELESIDSQLNLLESLDQLALLRYTVQDYLNTSAQMDAMVSAWRCGDHAKLADILFAVGDKSFTQLSAADQAVLDRLMRKLLDDRNVGMANKIDQYFTRGEGNYFVVVGAAHLLGDHSVVKLLQQKGYKVTPVRK